MINELDAWKDGFEAGKQMVFEMIREATSQSFTETAELISWIRKQEESSKNE